VILSRSGHRRQQPSEPQHRVRGQAIHRRDRSRARVVVERAHVHTPVSCIGTSPRDGTGAPRACDLDARARG
jgi:hypothetical protein